MPDRPTYSLLLDWMTEALALAPTSEPVASGVIWNDASVITLSVGIPPTITDQPDNAIINDGESITFTIAATNATSYQWRRNSNGAGWVSIGGATSSSYTLTNATIAADTGAVFHCIVTGPGGTTTSNSASLLFDTVASDYIAAVIAAGGTISSAKQLKVKSLVLALNDAGLLMKIKAMYLFHGGAQASARLNLINPTTVVGSFCGTFVGTPTLQADGGMTPSSGNYMISNFNPDGGGLTDLTGAGIGFYGQNNTPGDEYTIGLYNYFWMAPKQGVSYLALSNNYVNMGASENLSGFHFGTREPGTSQLRKYRNGTNVYSATLAFSNYYAASNSANAKAIVGGMREMPSTVYPSTLPITLAFFSKGMTAAEVTTLNTIIQDYVA